MAKRLIEVFTAGCSVCEGAVEQVKALACDNCEVVVGGNVHVQVI